MAAASGGDGRHLGGQPFSAPLFSANVERG
ncbi:hypothetical protein VTL71DRAFT_2333 [Oculimacula yallundae]|uniref:Uncharacterized protein n=1 Tax=Oculimacula yallundae TaxID=86028 RepID=A0ABR4C8K4_9HELO